MSPVKETDGEIDDGGIQADEFVFKAELFLPDSLVLEAMEQNQEEFLIEGPRGGVRSRRRGWSGWER